MNSPTLPNPLRVLLVQCYYPSHPLLLDDPPEFSQPMGLLYLAAAARENGHQVALADLYLTRAKEPRALAPWLENYQPDVVGISAPFTLLDPVVRGLAQTAKGVCPEARVVVGGAHASTGAHDLMTHDAIDHVFLGEAEESFCAYLASTPPEQIDGFAYRCQGQVITNPKKSWVADLDRLSFPARDLLDLPAYWERSSRAGLGRSASLITSRGCPYSCVFCSTHTVWGRRWRARSPENILTELKELKEKWGIETLSLEDDNFTLDQSRALAILQAVEAEGLDFAWATPNGLRADRLDRKLVRAMKRCGFSQVKVAVESGDPRVNREVVRKNLDLEVVAHIIRICAEEEMPTAAFFVLGFIGETPADMLTTIEYGLELQAMGLSGADFFMATPYPGTQLLAQAREQGLLLLPEEELLFANAFSPSLATQDWGPDLLRFMVRLGLDAFAGKAQTLDLVAASRQWGPAEVLRRGRELRSFSPGGDQAVFFLQEGWYPPEDWPPLLRWTKDSAGMVLLPQGEDVLRLTLCTHTPRIQQSPVKVCLMTEYGLLGHTWLDSHNWVVWEVPLKGPRKGGTMAVTIQVERSFVPAEEGMGEDYRRLGVAVSRVELVRRSWRQRRKKMTCRPVSLLGQLMIIFGSVNTKWQVGPTRLFSHAPAKRRFTPSP